MRAIGAHRGKVGMVLVLLPDVDAAVYNRVKYVGDILPGIHTVCSLDVKAANDAGRDQYLTNIALKVNCKLLGVNQSLDISKLGIIGEGKTIVAKVHKWT
jgi:eukaryotic translation initiation factor 2C